MRVLEGTDFVLPGMRGVYHGKVRDVYDMGDSLFFVASDRYSAFDRNLALIPHKGELLTAISAWWFEQTSHIVKNHLIAVSDVNVMWGKKYTVLPIEMIVRGYMTGVTNTSLWHTYSHGQRDYGTFTLPDGLTKNHKLPHAVLTPTTKFEKHDRPLTPQQAVEEGLVDGGVWEKLQDVALKLFTFGQKKAAARGLILVDTKYEFGLDNKGEVVLIDEIHTPDSSRYWRADSYQARLDKGEEPEYYDKEYLRIWFNERFKPYEDAEAPTPPASVTRELTKRYVFIYKQLTGKPFVASKTTDPVKRIEKHLIKALKDGHA